MSQDERPGDEEGQDELYAVFEALGGQLTWDELTRLLGSGEYRPALVRHVTLLLGGDATAADEVVRASFAALREAWNELGDPLQARTWLYRAVVDRAQSVRRRSVPQAAPGESAAGPDGLLALPYRQREAVVLRTYMGLSERQAAAAMSISTGAVRSHLARGMSSLRHRPGNDWA
jgi:DNA-directed RNA polymerase specialized sigma24 family protein